MDTDTIQHFENKEVADYLLYPINEILSHRQLILP